MIFYDGKLKLLHEQVSRKAHLESTVSELKRQKKILAKQLFDLNIIMNNEQVDVQQLEGLSLTSILYTIIGKKDDKLSKEREEAYAAKVKHDAKAAELKAVDEHIDACEKALSEISACEGEYAELLREKSHQIKLGGGAEAARILDLEERLSAADNQVRELSEAISAGKEAKDIAKRVLSSLNDAEGMGTWDLLGGGLIADLAKHSSLNEAGSYVNRLQAKLNRFKSELADVEINADIQAEVDGFLLFADHFFDGLFADYAVLERIERAHADTRRTMNQIDETVKQLKALLEAAEGEHEKASAELGELITNTNI